MILFQVAASGQMNSLELGVSWEKPWKSNSRKTNNKQASKQQNNKQAYLYLFDLKNNLAVDYAFRSNPLHSKVTIVS